MFFVSCTPDETEVPSINPITSPSYDVTSSDYSGGTLTFNAGANTPSDATYRLYIDPNTNPTTEYKLSTNSYSYSNLIVNTKYYWKVETLNNTGSVLATSLIFSFVTGRIYNGDLTLTQEEINTFEYTKVTGDLQILGLQNQTTTNLKGFRGLSEVEGYVNIWAHDNLESLEGLGSLTTIGGDLYIVENEILENLDGLKGVVSIGGDLQLRTNVALKNIDGLSNLVSVGERFIAIGNDVLTTFKGLDVITSVGGNIQITSNDNLIDLDGLETLTTVGSALYIGQSTNPLGSGVGNNILYNLCGVSHLITNGQIIEEEYFVRANAYNPTYTEMQTAGSGGCEF